MYLKRLQTIWLLVGALALVTFGPQAARAQDQAAGSAALVELRALISAQNQQLRQLQNEVRSLQDQQASLRERSRSAPERSADLEERIQAYEARPTSQLFISGYGSAGYRDNQKGNSSFGMLFVPIFHYKVTDQLHLTAELEFDLRGHESDVSVEYAQVDFLINDYMSLSFGKSLLPFNTFSERTHPAWINKLPTLPPIYGGHHGGGLGILPILSDTGVQLRGGFRLPWSINERQSRVNYALYLSNGPRIEEHSELEKSFHEIAEFLEAEGAIANEDDLLDALGIEEDDGTHLEFGETLTDNNQNKAFGGRFGFLPIPSLELGTSFMRGRFDDDGDLWFRMQGADLAFRYGALNLRGEFINLSHEKELGGTERKNGFYVQADVRLRDLLPHLRMSGNSPLAQTELIARYGEVDNRISFRETTLGLTYWITPTVPLKIAYTFRDEDRNEVDNDEFLLQLAFGF